VTREFVWLFYGNLDPETGRNKLVELFKMKDIKRFSEEIATKGVINVYFSYIEEIVHAFRDLEVTSPQLYFTFIESIENQFIAAWRYDPTGGFGVLHKYLELLNIKTIDHALITHPHQDHYNGIMQILENNPDLHLWMPRCFPKNAKRSYKDIFHKYFDRLFFPKIGKLNLYPLVTIDFLGPLPNYFKELGNSVKSEEEIEIETTEGVRILKSFINGPLNFKEMNNCSLVISITYCGITILLPGDLDEEGWKNLFLDGGKYPKIDILKIAHHGSETNTPKELIGNLFPRYGIVTFVQGVNRGIAVGRIRDMGAEECYYLGFSEKNVKYKDRISCSFAIKPNRARTRAVIVPMIYVTNEDGTISVFIRPKDKEVKKEVASPELAT